MVQTLRSLVVAVLLVSLPLASAFAGVPISQERGGIPTLAPILKQVTPAVVNISVVSQVQTQRNPLMDDPFFRHFFNLPDDPQPQQRMAAGSGVIVDAADGYVLTNHHVIADANEISVVLKDQRRFLAELVGSDPDTDIALLKIEPDNLVDITLGDSDALEVGDFVVAIGNPFALGQTVTSGIVSALGRSGINPEGFEAFIQTDASINPGNSGGALVTLTGELIGINSAIIAPGGGGNVGIGFAVPSNMAKAVMDQLLEFGEVRRGLLGVTIQDLTPDLAEALEIDESQGAIVTAVQPKSAAEAAGIEPGDIIVAVNGHSVSGASDLRARIGVIPSGEEVDVTLLRDGKEQTATAQLGKAHSVAAKSTEEAASKLAGVTLKDIEPGMPMHGKVEGVLVVKSTRPAAPPGAA